MNCSSQKSHNNETAIVNTQCGLQSMSTKHIFGFSHLQLGEDTAMGLNYSSHSWLLLVLRRNPPRIGPTSSLDISDNVHLYNCLMLLG